MPRSGAHVLTEPVCKTLSPSFGELPLQEAMTKYIYPRVADTVNSCERLLAFSTPASDIQVRKTMTES